MKTLQDQLAQYASYHRDTRNIATHFIGIPMIVLAIATLLSRPHLEVGGWPLTPAWVVTAATCIYYLRLHLGLGVLMCALLGLTLAFGNWAAAMSTSAWLSIGIGLFVVGWIFQFVGHGWEGKKPAFVDDLVGLIIGPLFVTVEALFVVGAMPRLRAEIESRVGGTRSGRKSVAS
ncbi:conserved membrane hypothetical protein [Burkholderiales bacterium 8X]|nr:conserved membrane hypothetical protein [Burkholderiales bacterium 8X]